MTLVSALVVVALIGGIYRYWSRWPLDVVALFCATFLLFYAFRALVISLELDPLYPDYLFGPTAAAAATRANLVVSLFLVGVITGLVLVGRLHLRFPRWAFPTIVRQPRGSRYLALTLGLTALGAVVTLALLEQHGGITGLVRTAKYERGLVGLAFLRIIPSMGAVVAVASALDSVRLRERRLSAAQRQRLVISVVCAFLNGVSVFVWGSRSVLAIVGFCLVAGVVVYVGGRGRRGSTRSRVWGGVLLAVVVAAVSVVGLRFLRDEVATGDLSPNLEDQTALRQFSVASNSTKYDAVVLAVRDWPSVYDFRGGEDFSAGAFAAVPRFILPDRPTGIATGSWFRRVYEPHTVNGWPPGAVGEWYLNFGHPGVLLGGVLSGVVLGLFRFALRSSRENPLAFVASAVVVWQVILLGVNIETPMDWVRWALPLVVVAAYLRAGQGGQGTPRGDRAAGGRIETHETPLVLR